MDLKSALKDPLWANHKLGYRYIMDRSTGWKIAYYPIFQDGKNGEFYDEPMALVEKKYRAAVLILEKCH